MIEPCKVFILGVLLYTLPPAFHGLAGRWYPHWHGPDGNPAHKEHAYLLRRKFWRAALLVVAVMGLVLAGRHAVGGAVLSGPDWLRVLAATMALTAAIGRGGWMIQSWDGNTVVERIDRGMYVIGQVGAAALLVFVLTL